MIKRIATVAAVLLAVLSCSTQKKVVTIRRNNATATLTLAEEKTLPEIAVNTGKPQKDTLKIVEDDGREILIMKAIRDEEGDMVATDVIQAAVVTARFRNVAERHGKVDLRFLVTVPASMMDSRWQVRMTPEMSILDSCIKLEPVVITGKDYRKVQLRGYQRYEKFIQSIITDTTRFIRLHELEVFLERNFNELYLLKNDTTFISDEQYESIFGVTQQEAVYHYTNQFAASLNRSRIARKDRMFAKYVRVPIVTEGLRLDTVIVSPNGDFNYEYTQTIHTVPKLKKVDIALSGAIFEEDRTVYDIPESSPLTFYISSLSTLMDDRERYLSKIVERKVEANTACYVSFAQGKSDIDLSLGNNESEIGRIRENLASLIDNEKYDLDSIVVTSSASPEGAESLNIRLSEQRSRSIAAYLNSFMNHYQDSVNRERGFAVDENGRITHYSDSKIPFISRSGGENWQMLDVLVRDDSEMTERDKEEYRTILETVGNDYRENLLQEQTFYRYIREHLYPRLRTTRLDFHLHRKGMVKDTVHTTVLDSVYAKGIEAIRDRDYETAVTLLRPYNDFNTAVAYCSMDYNLSALEILNRLEQTPKVLYMKAILHSRLGDDEKAVQCYHDACKEDQSLIHRGNLDPEISVLIGRYGLNNNDDDFEYDL